MALYTATHIDLVFPGKEFALERKVGSGGMVDFTKTGGSTIDFEDMAVLENLVNLSLLPQKGFTVHRFPVKIENVDAIPTWVVVDVKEA